LSSSLAQPHILCGFVARVSTPIYTPTGMIYSSMK
jgi:hypothetical protein